MLKQRSNAKRTMIGENKVQTYFDDCIIFPQNFVEHLTQLRVALRWANQHVKLKNCQFGLTEVESFGHLVSETGRTPLREAKHCQK